MTQTSSISFSEEHWLFLKSLNFGKSEAVRKGLDLLMQECENDLIKNINEEIGNLEMIIEEARTRRDDLKERILQIEPKQSAMTRLQEIKIEREELGKIVANIRFSKLGRVPPALSGVTDVVQSMSLEEQENTIKKFNDLTSESISIQKFLKDFEKGLSEDV